MEDEGVFFIFVPSLAVVTLLPRWVPVPSSAASSGISEVAAAACWAEMLFQMCCWVLCWSLMQPQGKGRDGDTGMVPRGESKEENQMEHQVLFQCLLKWGSRSV